MALSFGCTFNNITRIETRVHILYDTNMCPQLDTCRTFTTNSEHIEPTKLEFLNEINSTSFACDRFISPRFSAE